MTPIVALVPCDHKNKSETGYQADVTPYVIGVMYVELRDGDSRILATPNLETQSELPLAPMKNPAGPLSAENERFCKLLDVNAVAIEFGTDVPEGQEED